MKKSQIFTAILIIGLAVVLPLEANCQVFYYESQLTALIEEAWANNYTLASWGARLQAAEERIPQAGALPDPKLSLGLMNLPADNFDLNGEPMTATWVTLSQSIPLTRKYVIQGKIAALNWEMQTFSRRQEQLNVAERIGHTWYDWAFACQAESITIETAGWMEDLIKTVHRKYETGKGMQSDILRLETELAKIEEKEAIFRKNSASASWKMSALLGRSSDNLPNPSPETASEFSQLDIEYLQKVVTVDNPMLKMMEVNQAQAKQGIEIARRMWLPDLNISTGYGFRQDGDGGMDRSDFISISAAASLPIFGSKKQGRAVEEAIAMARNAEIELNDAHLQLLLKLNLLLEEDALLEEQISIYSRKVIPQAEAALASILTSYSVGMKDIDAVITAEITLLYARLELLARTTERAKVRISISTLTGGSDIPIKLQ